MDRHLQSKRELIDRVLRQLAEQYCGQGDLAAPIRYVLESPGKRVRAALVLWCCELVAGKVNRDAEIAAAAIEMVHAYSLVHDDLPAMDNDDLRRGLATCHKKFDEATAILTGDALLTAAFEILAKEISEPSLAVKLIGELAEAAGAAGKIAGQAADLKAESMPHTGEFLEYIHTNKTAKMFRCAAVAGSLCGNAAQDTIDSLAEYGLQIGLAFQIADDILDMCASSEQLGKTAGKDEKAGKLTYPALIGLEESKRLAEKIAGKATAILEPFGKRADTLRKLATALLERTR